MIKPADLVTGLGGKKKGKKKRTGAKNYMSHKKKLINESSTYCITYLVLNEQSFPG